MDFICSNPGLKPFVLSNVTLTGTRIGAGAYGSVDEVAISVCGAAKKIHDIFQDGSEVPQDEIHRASTQFVKECQLMSTLRHPNLVHFLGVCFFEGSRLPALVMERLLTSLHDLLAPETQPPPRTPSPLSFFKLGLKCSVLHNVASGLDYLHHQTPPIIHCDLSARNILLNSRLVGKLADLGVARIVPRMQDAATMTKSPGASVYIPPEAIAPSASNAERSKYDTSIDVFSLGVVTIFTVGETFPCDPLAPTYTNMETGTLIARTELQRRSEYMRNVNTQLRACGQFRGDHPLIRLIQQCLHNVPAKRPNISEVLRLLKEARVGIRDEESERNKVEMVRALQNQPRNQSLVQLIDDLVTENAKLQWQLQSSTQQQLRKEAELTRAEETIRREQMQMRELETERDELIQAKDRELAQVQQQLRQLRQQEQFSKRESGDLKMQLQSSETLMTDQIPLDHENDVEPDEPPHLPLQNYGQSNLENDDKRDSESKTPRSKLTVHRLKKNNAPYEMKRGSATTDGQFAYFTPCGSNSVYSYQWSTEKWDQLPPSPYWNSGLVIIDGELTTVGGEDKYRCTSRLFTLQHNRWVGHYPPMHTTRSMTTVVSTSDGNYIIVIGGNLPFGVESNAVEVFHVKIKRWWYKLTTLPPEVSQPSATICDNQLYVVGEYGYGYSCSLQPLLSSEQPFIWMPLPRLPFITLSTAATLCGKLVMVSGVQHIEQSNFIYQLVDGRWVKIGATSTSKTRCLVVNPSPDKMMIVGGDGGENSVEEFVVV